MSFSDPIAAGDGTLIRNELKSDNFIAGVSGWRIQRDGDAEFSDVTLRGSLETVGPNSTADLNGGRLLIYDNATEQTQTSYENELIQFTDDEFATTAMQIYVESSIDQLALRRPASASFVVFDGVAGYFKVGTSVAPIVTETWITPTLLAGWTHWGAPHPNVGYIRMPDGTVLLRGVARGGTQTNGTNVFDLPAGYRPANEVQFHVRGAVDSIFNIDTSGNAVINGMAGLPAGSPLTLDGVRFPLF